MPCVNSFMSLCAVEEVELEKVHNKGLFKLCTIFDTCRSK